MVCDYCGESDCGNNPCISCSNAKGRYERGEMGTPNTFKLGQKVWVKDCGDWTPAVIYSIDVLKTPKGDLCHYLCHYQHRYCYDEDTYSVVDFSWFEEIKARKETVKAIRGKGHFPFEGDGISDGECVDGKDYREVGALTIKKMPEKIISGTEQTGLGAWA